jgi:hypothetical protein
LLLLDDVPAVRGVQPRLLQLAVFLGQRILQLLELAPHRLQPIRGGFVAQRDLVEPFPLLYLQLVLLLLRGRPLFLQVGICPRLTQRFCCFLKLRAFGVQLSLQGSFMLIQ